jgi:PTH2 family peptidyl-tRNA hydrolase
MKQVILMRTDLGMSVGKMCAQAAHAVHNPNKPVVVLQVASEVELYQVLNKAKMNKVPYHKIYDAGLTEVPPGTVTCACVYDNVEKKVDKVTGALALL